MQNGAQETHLVMAMNMFLDQGQPRDRLIVFWGRNMLIKKFVAAHLRKRAPKPTVAHQSLVPRPDHVAKRVVFTRASSGSIDLTNNYIVSTRTKVSVKAKSRLHLEGSTAMAAIYNVPLPDKDELVTITAQERTDFFRGNSNYYYYSYDYYY